MRNSRGQRTWAGCSAGRTPQLTQCSTVFSLLRWGKLVFPPFNCPSVCKLLVCAFSLSHFYFRSEGNGKQGERASEVSMRLLPPLLRRGTIPQGRHKATQPQITPSSPHPMHRACSARIYCFRAKANSWNSVHAGSTRSIRSAHCRGEMPAGTIPCRAKEGKPQCWSPM